MNKKWIVGERTEKDLIDQLLVNRGVHLKYKEIFLNPEFDKNTYHSEKLPNIKKAVKRIEKAIKNKEKIGIFADYDADVIPGAAILSKLFDLLKLETVIYIPTREEGYGLNETGIRFFKAENCKVLVTVDLGIVNKKEVLLAKELGMDVIVTDHHEIQENKLPKEALAIVHPRLEKSQYKNGNLSGGAVAWKFAEAILRQIKGEKYALYAKWWLDLAAITLVCDNMQLNGQGENVENRTLVKYGLKVLRKTKNLGLRSLYEAAQIDPEKINTYTIGFQIGPRINAPGRMDHGSAAYYLLTAREKKEAVKIAARLNDLNSLRQKQLEQALKEAQKKIEKEKLDKKKIILLVGEKWSAGIIGLIAGRLLEQYSRPVIVFTKEKDNLHGSARSIIEFDMIAALEKTKKELLKFGGHKAAAGVTLKKNKFKNFKENIEKIADKILKDIELIPSIKVDFKILPEEITLKNFSDIQKMEPFGMGNPKPVFLFKDLEIEELKWMGREEKHLRLQLTVNSNQLSVRKELEAVSFNCKEKLKHLKRGDNIDIVGYLDENMWNGRRKLQVKIIDIKIQ